MHNEEQIETSNTLKQTKQLLALVFLGIGGLFVFTLFGMALAVIGFGLDLVELNQLDNYRSIQAMKVVQSFATVGTFILPALLFATIFNERVKRFFLLDSFRFDLFLLTLLLGVSAVPFIGWIAEWNAQVSFPDFMSGIESYFIAAEESALGITRAFLEVNTRGELMINILVIAVLPAIGEELFFRGALQQTLIKHFGNKHVAIWVTAFLFSAIHMQFFGFIPRMLLGALFGYLVIWGGSLWYPILAHFVNNSIAVLTVYWIHQGKLDKSIENFGGNEGDWFYVSISALLMLVLIIFFNIISIGKSDSLEGAS